MRVYMRGSERSFSPHPGIGGGGWGGYRGLAVGFAGCIPASVRGQPGEVTRTKSFKSAPSFYLFPETCVGTPQPTTPAMRYASSNVMLVNHN